MADCGFIHPVFTGLFFSDQTADGVAAYAGMTTIYSPFTQRTSVSQVTQKRSIDTESYCTQSHIQDVNAELFNLN